MPTIHKRRLVSGEIVWELTHGTGADRQRFTVGKTREEAQEALNHFNRQLVLHGGAPTDDSLDSVVGQDIQYIQSNRRPATRRRYVRVLQTFYHCFLPPYHPDVIRLLQVTPAHIEAYKVRRLFMTILLTGMRKGEVQHVTWTDVNFDLGLIFIQAKPEWQWKPKTDERVIPLSPTLRELLVQHHAERVNDGLVFPNKEGNLDTHILPKLKKVGRKAGLPAITVHALRHSFGAHLRMAGVNLADIADLLGHKDLATTQIYAKVQQDHLRAVIAKLAPVVAGAGSSLKQLPAKPESQST